FDASHAVVFPVRIAVPFSQLLLETKNQKLFREDHGGTAAQAERARSVAFVYANLYEPARAQIRKRFWAIALREGVHETSDGLRPHLQPDRAIACCALRQIFLPEVRNQIPEGISAQNHSLDYSVGLLGTGEREPLVVLNLVAHAAGLPAFG